jgi:riboflavin transporter FmnP
MNRTKVIVIGALMAALAAVFQSLPVLLTEIFILLTILSAIPIYISSRINPLSGVLSYFVAATLIFMISTHEGLFFLCTNGVVGLSLGLCCYYRLKKPVLLLICAAVMTFSLSIMNYGIGIPIFGAAIPGPFPVQLLLLLLFSAVYSFIFLVASDFIYQRVHAAG